LRAIGNTEACDYVMWADSSQYFDYTRTLAQTTHNLNVHDALQQLRASYKPGELPNLYGVAHCDCDNTVCDSNGAYVQPRGKLLLKNAPGLDQFELSALRALARHSTGVDVCTVINDVWIENPHLILANTHVNHALLSRWITTAVQQPMSFCRSHSQDQATWSLIISEHNLPIIAFQCPYKMKNLSNVLQGLSSGAFTWIDRSVPRWPFEQGVSHHAGNPAGYQCNQVPALGSSGTCPSRGQC